MYFFFVFLVSYGRFRWQFFKELKNLISVTAVAVQTFTFMLFRFVFVCFFMLFLFAYFTLFQEYRGEIY